MCTQQIVPYANDIAITAALMDGERFLSGDYVIDVNWTDYPESEDPHILKAIELISTQ